MKNFSELEQYLLDNPIELPEIPKLAQGTQAPLISAVELQKMKEAKEEAERKRQFRHDWIIAIVSALSGGLFGFLTSLIFWLIEK